MFVNLDACMASQAVTLAVHAKLQVGNHAAASADVADMHAWMRSASNLQLWLPYLQHVT